MTWEEIKAKRKAWKEQCPELPEITIGDRTYWINDTEHLAAKHRESPDFQVSVWEIEELTTWLASLFPEAARKGISEQLG